ncbi:MAG: ParB N-terminal domain-containing protein [Acidobacteria bacterium]|nr:ParB N-terminal domain-containing protein [Acidobacteriota bacterium]
MSPDLLDFDPENPRFAGDVSGKSQDEIQRYVYGKPHYASELVDSLLENGFIDYEPLVVKQKNGRFAVVEGNRRLAAIREIRANLDKYQGRTSDLDQIPVIVFPKKPDPQLRNEMRVYLGVRHLFGFREWPPKSKAQFLEREIKSVGNLDRVIKEVRLTKQQARRFLVPYRLLKLAGAALPPDEDFWVLGEALGRTGVQNFLQLDVDSTTLEIRGFNKQNFKGLLDDLYGPKRPGSNERDPQGKVIRDTRELAKLARVLGSEKASYVLHKRKSLEEAELYVDTLEESLKRLHKLTKDLDRLLKKILRSKKDSDAEKLLKTFQNFESSVKAFLKAKNA